MTTKSRIETATRTVVRLRRLSIELAALLASLIGLVTTVTALIERLT